MLCELAIENLALFESATLSLGAGLNAITGETGAGKSLLVDALELLLGERPRAAMVRKGAKEARVEGRFVIAGNSAAVKEIARFLAEHLPEMHEEWTSAPADAERELILARAVAADGGRSRAWINHRAVTQRVLRDLASRMVEIHGQNDHQRVLEPAEQIALLDAFGNAEHKLAAYRKSREAWLGAARVLDEFETRARERTARLDLLHFQRKELADAKPNVEEHRELLDERELQRNGAALVTDVGGIVNELGEEESNALDVVRRAARVLERWEGRIGALDRPLEELRAALAHLEEAHAALTAFHAGLEHSPQRLEAIEQRLFALEQLQKKYRLDVAGLVQRAKEVESELAQAEGETEGREALAKARDEAFQELETRANALSAARKSVRARLIKEVERRLAELGLERARFDVRLEPKRANAADSPNADAVSAARAARERRFGIDGADELEFLLAANPGEGAQPLRVVASGGEAARIMLALRTALAVRQTIPTLIFDEVDAGVGGRLGPKVGEHLRELARTQHQVVCVTHLPAIAALADQHFKVEKRVRAGRTQTVVTPLEGDARVSEVADMIAGGADQASAKAEARRLLGSR